MTAESRPDGARLPPGARWIRVDDAEVIHEPANAAEVRPLGRLRAGASSASVTWVSIDGRHRRLAAPRSERAYYVLSGQLTITLDGADPVTLGPAELLVIPQGCWYGFHGSATYLVINSPAFAPGDDQYADEPPARPS